MSFSSPDQRRSHRYRIRVRVLFMRDGTPHAVDAESSNISTDGVFVETTRRPLDVGTQVSLLVSLEGQDTELMLSGVVRWQGGGSPHDSLHGTSGMGIQFTNMDPDTQDLLARSIDQLY